MNSFVKQFVAFLNGDDDTVAAEKAFRKANSALKSSISSLDGDTIDLEDALESAKANLAARRINKGKPITDRARYVDNLIDAKNEVTDAEDALERHKAKLKFLKEEQANLSAEDAKS